MPLAMMTSTSNKLRMVFLLNSQSDTCITHAVYPEAEYVAYA